MDEKLQNLIYAMIVGNTIRGKIDGRDIWDCEESVKYYTELFLGCSKEEFDFHKLPFTEGG